MAEAQRFDATIREAAMRQTKGLLYCVWGDGRNDKLFVSLDGALDYRAAEFLSVVAKNSPEPDDEIVAVPGVGSDAAALFLGDDDAMALDFLIAQNSRYSITLRARGVTRADSPAFEELERIATTVLERLPD
jgi:hypothetical protein